MAQLDPELKRLFEALQGHLQTLRDLDTKKTKHIESMHVLVGQRNENDLVKQELNHLDADAKVFKLIGPALVSQDVDDAKHVVGRRLEHIAAEIKRVESLISDSEKRQDDERAKASSIQNQMRARQEVLQAQQAGNAK